MIIFVFSDVLLMLMIIKEKEISSANKRGKPCIFIGYPTRQKGYKVYDLQNQKIDISRDVTFLEEILPFKI